MAVAAGEETEIGGIFAKFAERIGLNDAGAIAFHGILKFAPVDAAIFVIETGRPRAVAKLGDPAPGGGTIAHFGLWPVIGPAGAATFAASIEGGPTSVAIVRADAAALTPIVAGRGPLPAGARRPAAPPFPGLSAWPARHGGVR